MTCIVGIQHEGGVTMAADSWGAAGWETSHRTDPKIYRVSGSGLEWGVGYTSSYRMGQLLGLQMEMTSQLAVSLKAAIKGGNVFRWVVSQWVEAARVVLRDGGYTKTENGREEAGQLLLAVAGRLFIIEGDWQVVEPEGPAAVGCGRAYALGAMWAMQDASPVARAEEGVEAAAHYSNGVGGPIQIEEFAS